MNNIFSWRRIAQLGMASLLLVSATGCIDDDANINPNQATDEMLNADNLRTGAFFSQMVKRVFLVRDGDSPLDSDYQIAWQLSHDLFSGYTASTLGGVSNHTQYIWQQGWVNSTWRETYTGVMAPWNQLRQYCEDNNNAELMALANVVKVAGMHKLADTFGPIPYCDYGLATYNGSYDSLQDVYVRFFQELDDAIDVLTPMAVSGAKMMTDYDYIYGGEVSKWVKFANTLRLRLAMRVAYVDPTLSRTEAEKSCRDANGLIETAAERAELQHALFTYHHPIYTIAYEFNAGDCRPNASITTYMSNMNDPRLTKYFKAAAEGGYAGVRLGVSSTANLNGPKICNFNIDNSTTPAVWMTAAESFFLRAEAALRGYSVGGDAATLYAAGVQASFDENQAGSAADYLQSDATPGSYTDPVASDNYAFRTQVTPKWDESANMEQKLERIMTQKWIANYPNGAEGWSEYRRTGYPELAPVVNNGSNNTVDTEIQVRRLPYPETELTNNAAGVATGVNKLGGPDNGGTKLWWDARNHTTETYR